MKFWYQSVLNVPALLLLPLTLLTKIITRRKRRNRNLVPYAVPLIVIGNVTVGGTGKTPMIIHLTRLLQRNGLKVGVVSRGYGAKPQEPFPVLLQPPFDAQNYGDEPALIARSTGASVIIDPDRHRAVLSMLERTKVDIIISDDGLQHYRMARDLEIIMIDGMRGLGNGRLLPAGPLREEVSRLQDADFLIAKQERADIPMVHSVATFTAQTPVNHRGENLSPQEVIVCSGIGNFESFVKTVEGLRFQIKKRKQYGDHQPIAEEDLVFAGYPILLTEKDYVKLTSPADHIYFVPLTLQLPEDIEALILNKILEKIDEKNSHHSR